jgi:ribosomal protein S18 acetylase RimI-like enzyme
MDLTPLQSVKVEVRPLVEEDLALLRQVIRRLVPGATGSPRDPAAMDQFFTRLESGDFSLDPGSDGLVASIDGAAVGLMTIHPDTDYFTGHPRAHVDHLAVAAEAEGKGVGRTLLEHAEQWARERGCREVVLDVFASNTGAIAFYERCGYRPDHIRMAKPVGQSPASG